MKRIVLIFILFSGVCASDKVDKKNSKTIPKGKRVLFVGDSVTLGLRRSDYIKSSSFTKRIGLGPGKGARYGYVEALCETTYKKKIHFKLIKYPLADHPFLGTIKV